MGQASYPPHPIRRRQRAVAVPGTVVVAATNSAYEGITVLFVERAAAPTASRVRAAKPGALPLLASERPFLLKLNDLCLTVDGNGDLAPAQATDAQLGMIFQELAIGPFRCLVSGPKGCDH